MGSKYFLSYTLFFALITILQILIYLWTYNTERRLENCVESLKKSGKLEYYEAVFNEWLQEETIEEVTLDVNTKNEYYLPHQAVIKENSTTKIRQVFDGSAKFKRMPSINDCLVKGPNLVDHLPSVIISRNCFLKLVSLT